jgi:hypothetical protein
LVTPEHHKIVDRTPASFVSRASLIQLWISTTGSLLLIVPGLTINTLQIAMPKMKGFDHNIVIQITNFDQEFPINL